MDKRLKKLRKKATLVGVLNGEGDIDKNIKKVVYTPCDTESAAACIMDERDFTIPHVPTDIEDLIKDYINKNVVHIGSIGYLMHLLYHCNVEIIYSDELIKFPQKVLCECLHVGFCSSDNGDHYFNGHTVEMSCKKGFEWGNFYWLNMLNIDDCESYYHFVVRGKITKLVKQNVKGKVYTSLITFIDTEQMIEEPFFEEYSEEDLDSDSKKFESEEDDSDSEGEEVREDNSDSEEEEVREEEDLDSEGEEVREEDSDSEKFESEEIEFYKAEKFNDMKKYYTLEGLDVRVRNKHIYINGKKTYFNWLSARGRLFESGVNDRENLKFLMSSEEV